MQSKFYYNSIVLNKKSLIKNNFALDEALEDLIINIHVKNLHNLKKLCKSEFRYYYSLETIKKKQIKKQN